MAGASGVLYVDVTNHLERRVAQHQQKLTAGFTSRYNIQKLVYFELFADIRWAIAREKQLKGWLRKRKIALIESMNPSWKDLASQLSEARAADTAAVTARAKTSVDRCTPTEEQPGKRDSSSLRSSE